MARDFKAFQKVLTGSRLSGKERDEAWRLFKQHGHEEAEAYIAEIEAALPPPAPMMRDQPVPFRVWGREFIEPNALAQMENAARLPVAVAGALMPDAHLGYGLPIGGVLATEGAVIPYAVGVDIACRMMLTIYPVDASILDRANEFKRLRQIIMDNTTFGAGSSGLNNGDIEHPLLDEERWMATPLLRSLRQTAIYQIGTSGTGNHFVDVGTFTVTNGDNPLCISPGSYLAVLSHSGSRGVGYKIADHYSKLAMSLMADLPDAVKHLAWLPLDTDAGREYWHAMNLAGEFASANHHIIHERFARALGVQPMYSIENHHNFAWREKIVVDGVEKEVIVHRKGATPAGKGVLGVIPGTMADPGYAVIGKGSAPSLSSASHGGGRVMGRNDAKRRITPKEQADYLASRGVTLIGGGLDEAPQAYKRIDEVMGAQSDLVEILGKFQPKLVRMAADKGRKRDVPKGIVDAEGD